MRRIMIAGNWKMHGSRTMVTDLLNQLKAKVTNLNSVDWLVLPPFVFLEQTATLLKDTSIAWGAQNLYPAAQGAFTGEISPAMLQEYGCRYVLVGHSERRTLFGETDEMVAKKFVAAKEQGLIPIFCVGETLAEREADQTLAVVTRQLNAVLNLPNGLELLKGSVLAYEPVWAIGTGVNASPEQAQAVHLSLREHIAVKDATIARQLTVLYGGSVKSSNAEALFKMPDIDGGLIGGASLQADEFLLIGQAAVSARE